ncbi:hypothetical protein CAAN3_07S05226 [[Candida] anglica]
MSIPFIFRYFLLLAVLIYGLLKRGSSDYPLFSYVSSPFSFVVSNTTAIHPPVLHLPVHVRFGDEGYNFPDLIKAAQIQLDAELTNLGVKNWTVDLVDELENSRSQVDQQLHIHSDMSVLQRNIQGKVQKSQDIGANNEYSLLIIRSNELSVGVDPEFYRAYLFYTIESVHSNDLPFYIAQTVLYPFLGTEIELFESDCKDIELQQNDLTVQFSNYPGMMMTESSEFLDWGKALDKRFTPFQTAINDYVNISVKVVEYEQIDSNSAADYTFICTQDETINYPRVACYEDLLDFINQSVLKIEQSLKIPANPNNNLRLKLQMMKRCLIMKKYKNRTDSEKLLNPGRIQPTYWDKLYKDDILSEGSEIQENKAKDIHLYILLLVSVATWCIM